MRSAAFFASQGALLLFATDSIGEKWKIVVELANMTIRERQESIYEQALQVTYDTLVKCILLYIMHLYMRAKVASKNIHE